MPTGTATLPLLRGYAPYGELDVNHDFLRRRLLWEIPCWEGSDRGYMTSRYIPGTGGVWIRPDAISTEPSWTWNPSAGRAGWPRGNNALQVYAKSLAAAGGQGYHYVGVWDVLLSHIGVGFNFTLLAVGTPMTSQKPNLIGGQRGNSWRYLFSFANAAGTYRQRISFNYMTDEIRWEPRLGGASTASPVISYYGERCSFLFVHGGEGGQTAQPRVFIGKEDGSVERADFSTGGVTTMFDAVNLELFQHRPPNQELTCAGGTWEYIAYLGQTFEEEDARVLCRDALGLLRWDPYVPRRVGWRRRVAQVMAQASVYGRLSARPRNSPRVTAGPTSYPRVSASARNTGARVTAEPTNYPRITARVRIADQEAEMQATPLCPSEMNWMADNVLELSEVLDDMQVPPDPITSATLVTCEIWDRDTNLELTVVSPVTLSQVGVTNAWRESVLVNTANGFSERQRLVLIFIFDGGSGLQGRFYALAVVAQATS